MRRWTVSAAPSSSSISEVLAAPPECLDAAAGEPRRDGRRAALDRSTGGRGSRPRASARPTRCGASRRLTVSTSGSSGISRSSRGAARVAQRRRRRARRRRAPRLRPASARAAIARVHVRERLAGRHLVTGLRVHDDARRHDRSDPPCARGPAPSRMAARPIASAPQRATAPARGAGTASTTGAASSTFQGSLGEARVAALRLDEPLEARAAPRPRRWPPRRGGARPPARRPGRRGRPCARPIPAPARGSRPDRRRPAARTTRRPRARCRPPSRAGSPWPSARRRVGRPARRPMSRMRTASSRADCEVGHERALPHLDVEQDRVGARRELLRHHRGRDQPGRRRPCR